MEVRLSKQIFWLELRPTAQAMVQQKHLDQQVKRDMSPFHLPEMRSGIGFVPELL